MIGCKQPRQTLAIDPGVHACGAALFKDDELLCASFVCEFISEHPWAGTGAAVWEWALSMGWSPAFHRTLIIEKPQIYPGPRQENPNNLLDLSGVGGFIAGCVGADHFMTVLPRQWKGTIPKAQMTARIESKLTPVERGRVIRVGAKDHNTLDAVGIGLYYLNRLNAVTIRR
jgi:hypothetical protein